MNTNPRAKVVLCYGDSNTRGSQPDSSNRFAADLRWTGKLQLSLGEGFYIIEEGMGGRTTNYDDFRSGEEFEGAKWLQVFQSMCQVSPSK